MRFPPEQIQVTCPQCGQSSTMPVLTIIDVSEEPYLRNEALRGNINVFTCPHCGVQSKLNVPYLYLDTPKEFAYMFVPSALNLTEEMQQRFIGDLTKAVMEKLPPQDRKGYLLRPQLFFSELSLQEAIWEKEGVSLEEQHRNQEYWDLTNKLLAIADDEDTLVNVVHEHDSEINEAFMQFLDKLYKTYALLSGEETLDEDEKKAWQKVFATIKDHSNFGQYLRWREEASQFLQEEPGPEVIIERLLRLHQENNAGKETAYLDTLLPALDYSFLMILSNRIEVAEKAERQEQVAQLTAIRTQIVQRTEEERQRAEALLAEGNDFLEKLLQAEEQGTLKETIHKQPITAFSDIFRYVLENHLKSALDNGLTDLADRLMAVRDGVDAFTKRWLQSPSDPFAEIVDKLMTVPYPEETLKLLQALKQQDLLGKEFIGLLEVMSEATDQFSEEERQRLKTVYAQALTV